MAPCKLRIELALEPGETLLLVQVVLHLAELHDDADALVPRELADLLVERGNAGTTPEAAFAALFGSAPPSWDVHPNAWPYGLSVVTDIDGRADLDQLNAVLRLLLSDRIETATISGRIARDGDGELWTALVADKQWLGETTPSALDRRRLH